MSLLTKFLICLVAHSGHENVASRGGCYYRVFTSSGAATSRTIRFRSCLVVLLFGICKGRAGGDTADLYSSDRTWEVCADNPHVNSP